MISLVIGKVNKQKNLFINKNENKSSLISMMLEDKNGNYVESDELPWPVDGYKFNAKLSKCTNGSKLKYDEKDNTINVETAKTDKCYAYFDILPFAEYLIKNHDKSLIYHDGKCDYEGEENCELEAGDMSYRYSGARSKLNIIICLDGSSATTGSCKSDTNNLYQVIGLFLNENGKYEVKLIKYTIASNTDLGDETVKADGEYSFLPSAFASQNANYYYWNNADGNNSVNRWADSNLNKVNLNSYYYKYITQKNAGLASHIAKHLWIVGGTSESGNAKAVYDSELGAKKITESSINCYDSGSSVARQCNKLNDLTYSANIGMMYISDYMYGTTPENWGKTTEEYTQDEVKNNNSMLIGTGVMTITRNSTNNHIIRTIAFTGNANSYQEICSSPMSTRPSFYLTADTKIAGGSGTTGDPYRLLLK